MKRVHCSLFVSLAICFGLLIDLTAIGKYRNPCCAVMLLDSSRVVRHFRDHDYGRECEAGSASRRDPIRKRMLKSASSSSLESDCNT